MRPSAQPFPAASHGACATTRAQFYLAVESPSFCFRRRSPVLHWSWSGRNHSTIIRIFFSEYVRKVIRRLKYVKANMMGRASEAVIFMAVFITGYASDFGLPRRRTDARPRPVRHRVLHRKMRLYCEKYIGAAEGPALRDDEMAELRAFRERVGR
jgi:hypothetical protein